MTNAERAARRRSIWIERKNAGLCPRCGRRPPTAGYQDCFDCRERRKTTKRLRHDNPNWRTKRQQQLPAGYDCPKCKQHRPASSFGRRPDRPRRLLLCRRCQRDKAVDDGKCAGCFTYKTVESFKRCAACMAGNRQRVSRKQQAIKLAAMTHYSKTSKPSCACCDEDHYEFLSIDHINNDGSAHRKTIKAHSIYGWLKKHNYPLGFQVLCMNCNWAKGKLGHCPHEREQVSAMESHQD